MYRTGILIMTMAFGTLLAGCGSDSSSSGDGNNVTEATIDSENALKTSQEATRSLTEISQVSEDLGQLIEAFGSMSSSKQDYSRAQKLAARADETLQCPGGGTLTVSASDGSGETQSIDYVADQCVTDAGTTVNGELHLTIGPWNDYPENSFEFIMETGSDGLTAGDCGFTGGLVTRLHSDPATEQYGENFFVIEIGTTDAGFTSNCGQSADTNLAANTLVRNEYSYSYAEDGSMTSSSSVNISGGFEAPDGSGYVEVSATGLEYGVAEDGSSQFGEMACPTAGELTVTGANDSTVSVYFGDDAPAPYVVQVIGPDGFVAEYETCDAFLAASE